LPLEPIAIHLVDSRFNKTFPGRLAAIEALLIATGTWAGAVAEEREVKPVTVEVRVSEADPDIQTLIGQLSDDEFAVRQAAAERLLSAGTPARAALVVVAGGPDPEARAAARRLVALIDRTDFNRRLEAFAADTDGKRGLTLPGWEQFRKLVGNDPAARTLFVDMQRAEGTLIAAAFGVSSQPPEELWEERITRLVTWQMIHGNRTVAPPLGSCATMVFLGSVPEIDVSDRGAQMVENLIQRPPISEAFSGSAPQDAVRRLVISWILHCPNNSEVIVASRLQLMSGMNLKAGLPLALAVAGGAEPYADFNAPTRAWAMLVVGQFGGPEHAEKLEPMLSDTRVCMPVQAQPNQPLHGVQVRDVAMCVMLQLTRQKPADYGYLHARLQPHHIYDISSLHATNDKVRTDAAMKWKAWRESKEGEALLKAQGTKGEVREPVTTEKKRDP
jgi:hypothetical protein